MDASRREVQLLRGEPSGRWAYEDLHTTLIRHEPDQPGMIAPVRIVYNIRSAERVAGSMTATGVGTIRRSVRPVQAMDVEEEDFTGRGPSDDAVGATRVDRLAGRFQLTHR